MTEHSSRYGSIVRAALASNIGVCAFDLRGHGRSSGRRGHVDRWQDFVLDVDTFLNAIRSAHPGPPIFLFGHSLGSLIVLSRVAEAPRGVAGAIVCGTAIEPVGVARRHLVFLARTLSSIWPTFSLPVPRRAGPSLTRDPRAEAEFWADPLVLKSVTARFGVEALAMIEHVKRCASKIQLPLLMIHGGVDPLNSLAGAQRFFNEVPTTDKQFIVYPDSYHEPHNDLDAEKVASDLINWILDRV